MSKKVVSLILIVMAVILIFLSYFTSFSQNQIYLLREYQNAYQDFKVGQYDVIDEVYIFENSLIEVSMLKEVENGILFKEDDFTLFTQGQGVTQSYEEFKIVNLESLFTNFLINYYSVYGSIVVLIVFLLRTLLLIVAAIVCMYGVYRVILHIKRRDDIVVREFGFKDYSFEIAMCLFIIGLCYSYLSLITGSTFSEGYFYIGCSLIFCMLLLKKGVL